MVTTKLKENKVTQKHYCDNGTKQQTGLLANNPVRVQMQNHWIPAKVIKPADYPNS